MTRGGPPPRAPASARSAPGTPARSAPGTPGSHFDFDYGGGRSSRAGSSVNAATPSSAAKGRRMADLEMRLWQADQKQVDAQSKLTAANLELARLRAAAETHQQELNYTKRLLEREQRDRHPLEAELHATKDLLRAERHARRVDAEGATGERLLLLKAQLEDAAERAQRLQAENERLRDEAAAARKAVDLKGEGAKLQLDANQLKEERLRLALELHEAKQDAAKAKHDAAESREALRSVDGMRATLAESQAALTAARRDVERLVGERAAALEEHGEVLQQAKGLADELDAVRAAHAQVGAQRAPSSSG